MTFRGRDRKPTEYISKLIRQYLSVPFRLRKEICTFLVCDSIVVRFALPPRLLYNTQVHSRERLNFTPNKTMTRQTGAASVLITESKQNTRYSFCPFTSKQLNDLVCHNVYLVYKALL